MFSFRPARTLGVSTALALVGAAACGDAQKTPFYDSPAPLGSASNGSLVSAGGSFVTGGATNGGTTTNDGGTGVPAASGAGGSATTTNGGSAGGIESGGRGGSASGASGNPAASTGGESGAETGGTSNDAGAPDGQAGAAGAPSVDCTPHGALAAPFEGHCYELAADSATFPDAVADCESRGAHLVTISSAGRTLAQFLAENTFVWRLTGSAQSWIGATDGKGPHAQGDGSPSEWITGEPMDYDNWSSGQPNNARTSCQDKRPCSCDKSACYEHCGFQWDTPGKQMDSVPGWNDRLCDHVLNYVCEWDE